MTARAQIEELRARMGGAIIGQREVIDRLLIGLLANGNLLVEGLPGLAKTRAIKALARNMEARFSRIQFTPDLLPSDVTGTEVYYQTGGRSEFRFEPGPIFANIVLADEINRAPAKVQAALLEAMEERQVTVAGKTHPMEPLFMVMATQNPIEQEGTYPLPEAQMDRFLMHVLITYPPVEDEVEVIRLVRAEEIAALEAAEAALAAAAVKPRKGGKGRKAAKAAAAAGLAAEVVSADPPDADDPPGAADAGQGPAARAFARAAADAAADAAEGPAPPPPDPAPEPPPEASQDSLRAIPQSAVFAARREIAAIHVSAAMERYMADLVNATRIPQQFGPDLPRWIEIGASPRASLALDKCGRTHAWLAGRDYVDPEDVRAIAPDVLRHRLGLSFEAQGEGIGADRVIEELLAQVALP